MTHINKNTELQRPTRHNHTSGKWRRIRTVVVLHPTGKGRWHGRETNGRSWWRPCEHRRVFTAIAVVATRSKLVADLHGRLRCALQRADNEHTRGW